jgi:NAD(P)-dependent dehydrogenase (short-subunit alcohol dehydrogenase family)
MDRMKGKVAIVTGGAMGIGRSACSLLAREAATVALTDILEEPGRRTTREIQNAGGTAAFWKLDVAQEADVKRVFADIKAKFGRIDVLVNNAGISGVNKPTHEVTEAEWDALMAVNVKGVFFCTKHVIPYMKAAGGGSIINLSSIYGLVGAGDVPPYHASKGAVRLMTKNDAVIYAPDKIRVNSIHPGFIWTPMVENFAADMPVSLETARKEMAAKHPLGHIGEPDDIGWGVVYLASDESKFITGSELVIDGGYTAQ